MKLRLLIVETLLFFVQILVLFFLPTDYCKHYCCSCKLVAFFPVFLGIIFILFCINLVSYFITMIGRNYLIKVQIFVFLISIYTVITSGILFSKFGHALKTFEVVSSSIILLVNFVLLFLYYKYFRNVSSQQKA